MNTVLLSIKAYFPENCAIFRVISHEKIYYYYFIIYIKNKEKISPT